MANCIEYLQQAHQLLATARTLHDQANKGGLAFVTTELDITREFAERALAAFSAGEKGDAKQAAAAKATYRVVQKYLPHLFVQGEHRKLILCKLRKLTPLIEELSTIR